jgi:hypothetical protein
MVPKSSRFSGTRARPRMTRSSSVRRLMSSPSKSSRPREGSRPIKAPSIVLLPAPLGPITVITLPAGALMFRPRSTSALP